MKHKKTFFFAALAAGCLFAPFHAEAEDAARAVTVHAPATVFIQGEPLKFTLKLRNPGEVKWSLLDWKDIELRSGMFAPDGTLALEALPNGYYKLKLSSSDAVFSGVRTFTVVPDPAKRTHNPEMFYAVDSAQSWLAEPNRRNVIHPEAAYGIVSEAARRGGMTVIRDRLRWTDCERKRGEFSWGRYMQNAELLSARGIGISGMFHDTPVWNRGGNEKLPADLGAVYEFCKTLAVAFKGKMTDWEFWNEQDIGFAPEGAWDYAAAMKAAYLGFKAGDPSLPVAFGGLARTVSPYAHSMLKNGLRDYFDIFNVHTYAPLNRYPEIFAKIEAFRKQYGVSERPLWFTESGCRAEGSAQEESGIRGVKRHSPRQELVVAEYLPKMMIGMQNLGADRDFFFVLPAYNENGGAKDWGLMRRDYTVKPGYTAFSNLADMLGSAVLEGKMEAGKEIRAFLFRQPDGSQTVAFWSVSEVDEGGERPEITDDPFSRTLTLAAKDGVYSGTDIFGTPFRTEAKNGKLVLNSTRMPAYISGLAGLKPSVPFVRGKRNFAPAETPYDRTIVYRVALSEDFRLSSEKDAVDVTKEKAKLTLEVWNLSAEPKTGTVHPEGVEVSGLPQTVTLKPFGKAVFPLEVVPVFRKDFTATMTVAGTFNGKAVSPLEMDMFNSAKRQAESRVVIYPEMQDAGNWKRNSSGRMTIINDPAEQAIRFETKFSARGDRWIYPTYELQLPQESLKNANSIVFDVKAEPSDKVLFMLTMTVTQDEQGKFRTDHLRMPKPSGDWKTCQVSLSKTNPERIVKIRIGLNPNTDSITYWIRNVRILYNK